MHNRNVIVILLFLSCFLSCDERKQIEEAKESLIYEDSLLFHNQELEDSLRIVGGDSVLMKAEETVSYQVEEGDEYHDYEEEEEAYSSGFTFPLDSADPVLKHGPVMREIETEKWKELSEATDYSVEPIEEKPILKDDSTNTELLTGIFNLIKYFSIAIFIGLLLWLLFLFIRQSNANKLPSTVLKEDIVAVKVGVQDFDLLLKDAMEKGAYRESISYALQNLLHSLNNAKMLDYGAEKTNSDYCHEIKDDNIKRKFKSLVNDFEKYWYGDKELTQEQALAFIENHYKLIQLN